MHSQVHQLSGGFMVITRSLVPLDRHLLHLYRPSSEALAKACADGAKAMGATVKDYGKHLVVFISAYQLAS